MGFSIHSQNKRQRQAKLRWLKRAHQTRLEEKWFEPLERS